MVKPPKTMQPESVPDLAKAGRDKTKAFSENSFHGYMARKIDRQRQQFGLVVPPLPLERADDQLVDECDHDATRTTVPLKDNTTDATLDITATSSSVLAAEEKIRALKEQSKKRRLQFGITAVLQRLQRRHGMHSRKRRRRTSESNSAESSSSSCSIGGESSVTQPSAEIPESQGAQFSTATIRCPSGQSTATAKDIITDPPVSTLSTTINNTPIQNSTTSPTTAITSHQPDRSLSRRQCRRADLFFTGVVVLVNGYTNPDAETLQRLLHRHGGDLEKYETSRITHIIAERLSHAKALMYARRKVAPILCRPAWIVDSVQAARVLPVAQYLVIDPHYYDVAKGRTSSGTTKSVTCFFQSSTSSSPAAGAPAASLSSLSNKHHLHSCSPSVVLADSGGKKTMSMVWSEEVPRLSQESGDHQEQKNMDYGEEMVDGGLELSRIAMQKCENDVHSDKLLDTAESTELDSNADLVNDLGWHPACENGDEAAVAALDLTTAAYNQSPAKRESRRATTDPQNDRYINGRIRTVGTDPNFLESFFAASRLSFIGSYKQRAKQSPTQHEQAFARDLAGFSERFIFHVDMDCFFASVVLRKFPQYRNKPVVISHHGEDPRAGGGGSTMPKRRDIPKESSSECATCNYEARKYGIQKGMYLGRAKALCPDLIILQYDFEGYEEVSDAVADILERHATENSGYVEHVSCDEAYIEFYLTHSVGDDTDSKTPRAMASALAETIRQEIFETTQCTATVGVGPNKFLAKLATDHVKPNRTFVVVDDCRELLASLQLRDLHGVGYRLERKLAEEDLVSVQDVWDLGPHRGEHELCRILGPGLGKRIFGYCKGKDDRPVQAAERKTIGAECNYGVRFDGPYGVDHMVEGLCREVEHRMTTVGVKGLKITLKVKQRKKSAPPPPKFLGHGSCHNLSKSQNVDGGDGKPTRYWKFFFDVAMQLLSEMKVPENDIRGMGIVLSKLIADKGEEKELAPTSKPSITSWFSRQQQEDDDDCGTDRVPKRKSVAFNLPAESFVEDVSIDSTNAFAVRDQNDEDDNHSFIVNLPENAATNTATTGPSDFDFDIALPSLSQIHMSQVVELPSPMRRQIVSKMEKAQASATEENVAIAVRPTDVSTSPQHHVSRLFRQTDVKRMFKLAALKSGEHELAEGNAVSLTQLEDLPLELQLQVANDDQRKIGLLSPQKKQSNTARRKPQRQQLPQGNAEKKEVRHALVTAKGAKSTPVIDMTTEQFDPSIPMAVEAPMDFYHDNILPLSNFLDAHVTSFTTPITTVGASDDAGDNDDVSSDQPPADAQRQVAEFLCQCAREHRYADVVLLLRSMHHRGDVWSRRSVLNAVAQTVNQQLEQDWGGASLDWDWIRHDDHRPS